VNLWGFLGHPSFSEAENFLNLLDLLNFEKPQDVLNLPGLLDLPSFQALGDLLNLLETVEAHSEYQDVLNENSFQGQTHEERKEILSFPK
jgi:hypothetical protein